MTTSQIVATEKPQAQHRSQAIPWAWVRAAYDLQPACMLIALVLWQSYVQADGGSFRMNMNTLAAFLGISFRTVQRGIRAMLQGGMIEIERHPGACHAFTIKADLSGDSGASAAPSLE